MTTQRVVCAKCGEASAGPHDADAPCPSCGHDRNLGRRLGDRFVVEERLGQGGIGSIYRGRDERLGAPVAIKLLKSTWLRDTILRERFKREATSLSTLRHPGIVAVLDFGDAGGGDLYTVLELIEGKTLSELIAAQGSDHPDHPGIPLSRALPMFEQILRALEMCHAQGVVHRDIKPSNIMVTREGRVTVLDFGLAHVPPQRPGEEKLTETGVVQGTPHYMAPEQCRGEDVSPATDVYACGAVFYEMLAGVTPLRGTDAATIMAQHLFVDPPALTNVAPHVSPGLASAIHRALSKRPEDRPSAQELRAAISDAAAGVDPQTRAAESSVARRHVAGLPRAERALRPHPTPEDGAASNDTPEDVDAHEIIVWMPKDDRAARLLGALGASGVRCMHWSRDEAPLSAKAISPSLVVLSTAHGDAKTRIAALRANDAKRPVVLVDVDGPGGTTAAIRAGATDMMLREAPDADLAAKVKKILARTKKRGGARYNDRSRSE